MSKLSIRDLDLTNKRVLIRVDFNVPLKGRTSSPTTLASARPSPPSSTPSVAKPRVILCSHLGRPKGKVVSTA